jgi:hypothetical protein
MRKDIDLGAFFKMDRNVGGEIIFGTEEEDLLNSWLDRPVEERYYAIEFLRAQWIEMNNLDTEMDRNFFEYR